MVGCPWPQPGNAAPVEDDDPLAVEPQVGNLEVAVQERSRIGGQCRGKRLRPIQQLEHSPSNVIRYQIPKALPSGQDRVAKEVGRDLRAAAGLRNVNRSSSGQRPSTATPARASCSDEIALSNRRLCYGSGRFHLE